MSCPSHLILLQISRNPVQSIILSRHCIMLFCHATQCSNYEHTKTTASVGITYSSPCLITFLNPEAITTFTMGLGSLVRTTWLRVKILLAWSLSIYFAKIVLQTTSSLRLVDIQHLGLSLNFVDPLCSSSTNSASN